MNSKEGVVNPPRASRPCCRTSRCLLLRTGRAVSGVTPLQSRPRQQRGLQPPTWSKPRAGATAEPMRGSGTASTRPWEPGTSPRATAFVILLTISVTHSSAGQQCVALVPLPASVPAASPPEPQFLPVRNTITSPNKHREGRSETSQAERYPCVCRGRVGRKGRLAVWGISPTPKYRSGLQKSLTSCKRKSTKGKRTMQLTRHPMARALPDVLFSSPPLGEKSLSVTPLLVFLPSTRADLGFPKSQVESSSVPAPRRSDCSPGGEEEGGGGLCTVPARPWGPAIAKPQLSCSDPPRLLFSPSQCQITTASSLLGEEGQTPGCRICPHLHQQ